MRVGHISTLVYTWLFGRLVGRDGAGNRYFSRARRGTQGERRWVIYQGEAEATDVPPQWHSWLHHGCASPPECPDEPQPRDPGTNTGPSPAARPAAPGGQASSGQGTTGAYQPWTPGSPT